MLRIRLARGGAKKRPFYRIVVADSRSPRDGRFVACLGFFNPIAVGGEQKLKIDAEKLAYWEKVGAQASDRVASIIKDYRKTLAGVAA